MNNQTHNTTLETWGAGQLFAFSGVDGPTCFDYGLTARSHANGLQFHLPGPLTIDFGQVTGGNFGGDWFQLKQAMDRYAEPLLMLIT